MRREAGAQFAVKLTQTSGELYLAVVDTGCLHSGRHLVAALCDALVSDAPQLVPVRRPHKPPDDASALNT